MSTVTLKLHKTDSTFIEKVSHCIPDENGDWYYMPFWFCKVGEGLYTQYSFEDLPSFIKDQINKNRELYNTKP